MFSIRLLSTVLVFSLASSAMASYESAKRLYDSGRANALTLAQALVDDGYTYSALPWIKDLLARSPGQVSHEINAVIEMSIEKAGIRPFEGISNDILGKSNSESLRFVVGKKLFREGKYDDAIRMVSLISEDHPRYPFAKLIEAGAQAILNHPNEAMSAYEVCAKTAQSHIGGKSKVRNRQMEVARDQCILGKARVLYAKKEYSEADLAYLDLSKGSAIWPDILYEEAWTSFQEGNYNRALGKIATYRSPFLDYMFNPETDVLKALTYHRMCLWNDLSATVDDFYSAYTNAANDVRVLLKDKSRDYAFFFNVALERHQKETTYHPLFNKMLKMVIRGPAYQEMMSSFKKAIDERKRLKEKPESAFKQALLTKSGEAMAYQRDSIGLYVYQQLMLGYSKLYKAFQDMSFIKLDMLSRQKQLIRENVVLSGRSRGHFQYVKRNDKQYFWTFNGEFWADELGDYVFALKSECE